MSANISGFIVTDVNKIIKELSKPWAKAMAIFGTKSDKSMLDLSSTKSISELAKTNIKKNRSNLISLWQAFTIERDEISKLLLTKKETSFSYLAGFHMSNLARVVGTFRRVSNRHPNFADATKGKHIHIFDIGCGTGACSLALTKIFKKNYTRSYTYYLTDASSSLLDIARHQLEEILPAAKIISQKKLIENLDAEQFTPQKGLNIYAFGYVWNELKKNRKGKKLIEKIISQISKSEQPSILLITEPANEQQAKAAMELRNQICETGLNVVYPCSHNLSCPLIETSRDWCYSEFDWEKPYLQKFVDTILDLKRTNLGASSYLFINQALDIKPQTKKESVIIGKPNISKKKQDGFRLLLCSSTGVDKSSPLTVTNTILKGEIYHPNQKNKFKPKTTG